MSKVGRLRIGYFGACTMFICITAYVLAESPEVTLLHQRASPNRVSLLDCSDCYWLERKLPGGLPPTRKPRLSTAHPDRLLGILL